MICSCGEKGLNHGDCGGVLLPMGNVSSVTTSTFNKQHLLEALKDCANYDDAEIAHSDADEFLLRFINDEAITEAFNKVKKYYA